MPPSWHPVPACVRDSCCRRNHSSLPLRRLASDAEQRRLNDRSRRCLSSLTLRRLESDAKQRRLNERSRRNYSSLTLRKLESDAERCCGRDRCRSGGFVLRIMPPSWHPVPACVRDGCCRRNNSRTKPCSDSQIDPLKSRITARWKAFPGKSMQ